MDAARLKDHTVATVLTRSQFKHQEKNPGVTESAELPDCGHRLTIDHGSPEVAQATLSSSRHSRSVVSLNGRWARAPPISDNPLSGEAEAVIETGGDRG